MPELGEAYTMAKELLPLQRKYVTEVTVLGKEKNFPDIELAQGQLVHNIFSYGKKVIFQLDLGYLLTSLSMTGKWLYEGSEHYQLCSDHIQLKIGFGIINMSQLTINDDGKKEQRDLIYQTEVYAYLADSRTWAKVEYLEDKLFLSKLSQLGPDPIRDKLSLQLFQQKIQKQTLHRRAVCDFLNDQSIIAGIGNWMRAEILYYAKIHPFRKLATLSQKEIASLYEATMLICRMTIKSNGLSIDRNVSNYASPTGQVGKIVAAVYNCNMCPNNHPVKKQKRLAGGQTLHFCEIEQL